MWASAPTTTRATAYECAGDFYKNSCIPPGGRSHPPLPAAPDFGCGRLTSVESPQTPCTRRGCAGGSAFFGTFLPCRTAERVRHPPRPEKSSSSRQDLQRSAADTARSVRPLRLCQAAFRHQRDRERETAYGWAQDTPKVGCPRPGAVRAGILPDCRRKLACRTRRQGHLALLFEQAAAAVRRGSPAFRKTDNRLQSPGASRYSSAAGSFFSSSKPVMLHSVGEPGGNGYRIMDKPPFL